MRLYEDGEFVAKEDSRKSVRDTYRERFFSSLSVTRSEDPFAASGFGDTALSNLLTLAGEAMTVHGDDISALKMSVETLSQLGLASSNSTGTSADVLSYQNMTVTALAATHFLYSWRP